jgi:endonuclease/exonuclease/phosphatase family metal-dependent hydrolase
MKTFGAFVAMAATVSAGSSSSAPDLLTGSFAAQQSIPTSLKILDWNIDKGKQFDRIVRFTRELAPDICILQEVDWRARRTGRRAVPEELARALGMNYVFGRAFQELGQGTARDPAYHGQAILTELPVRSARVVRFQRQSGFWKPRSFLPNWPVLQRRDGGRLALVAELQARSGIIVVYDLHLESRGFGATRRAQLEEVIADAQRYSADTPVIVAGDLNTKYHAGSFLKRLEKAGFRSCFGERKVRTHKLIGALDWVFVRGPAQCVDAEVVRGSGASDHDPIAATVTLPDASRGSATRAVPSAIQSRRE